MLILLLLTGLLIYISIVDYRQRLISNILVFFVALLCCMLSIEQSWALHASAYSAMLLSAGLVLFHLGWVGGGDIKLIAALSLAVAPAFLPAAVIAMLLVGGVLAAAYWVKYRWWQRGKPDSGLPYGIAICAGFYPLIVLSSYYP
ncbi:prepilin peptidase [Vibrio cholerae]